MACKVALPKTPSARLNFILSFDYLGCCSFFFYYYYYFPSGTSKGTCRLLRGLILSLGAGR